MQVKQSKDASVPILDQLIDGSLNRKCPHAYAR